MANIYDILGANGKYNTDAQPGKAAGDDISKIYNSGSIYGKLPENYSKSLSVIYVVENGVPTTRIIIETISPLERIASSGSKMPDIKKTPYSPASSPAPVLGPYNRSHHSLENWLDNTNESRTVEVDYLGGGNGRTVLGMYNPATDTVYVLKNLSGDIKNWVKHHEWEHRYRQYFGMSQDEEAVDASVSAKLGYNPFPGRMQAAYSRAA